MAYDLTTRSPGVLARHADGCPAREGGTCTCGPIGYRAAEDGHPVGPLLETEADALAWRREQYAGLDAAEHGATVAGAIDDFVEAAASGRARDDRGRAYTPAALREVRWALSNVTPALRELELHDVRPRHVHAFLDRLAARMPDPQVEAVEDAVRAFFDYALEHGLVDQHPLDPAPVAGPAPEPVAAGRPAMVPDEAIWLSLKVVTVVFVLIALILVAESV